MRVHPFGYVGAGGREQRATAPFPTKVTCVVTSSKIAKSGVLGNVSYILLGFNATLLYYCRVCVLTLAVARLSVSVG